MIEYPEPGQIEPMSPRGRFGAIQMRDALAGKPCILCDYPLRVGDVPALIKKQGGDHVGMNVECAAVHQRCLYGVTYGSDLK